MGLRYSGFRRLWLRRRDIEIGRIHRGQRNVGRMDWHHYGLIRRGRLWVLPAVIVGTIKRNDRTLTLHRGVAHLELRRRHCNRTGRIDLGIGKLRVEANGAAMDYSCGSGKAEAEDIYLGSKASWGTRLGGTCEDSDK
eukprot:scaffold37592_cov275-Isochrysis_galbana.AAC.1